MRNSGKTWFSTVVFPMIILLALLSPACAGTAPQELEVPVKLTSGQLDPGTIRVGQNDTVTLKIESDQPGALHLHGYDLEQEVESGGVTELVFVADASGRFRIAFHGAEPDGAEPDGAEPDGAEPDGAEPDGAEPDAASHEESGHGEVFQAGVMQPGDTFSLVVTQEMEGKVISYHSHLQPEVTGTVEVSMDAPDAGTIQIEIRDGETEPSEVMVRPGTTIIWTNNSSEMQSPASGTHVDVMEDSHQDSGHSHPDSSEVQEIDVGFLEVQPR